MYEKQPGILQQVCFHFSACDARTRGWANDQDNFARRRFASYRCHISSPHHHLPNVVSHLISVRSMWSCTLCSTSQWECGCLRSTRWVRSFGGRGSPRQHPPHGPPICYPFPEISCYTARQPMVSWGTLCPGPRRRLSHSRSWARPEIWASPRGFQGTSQVRICCPTYQPDFLTVLMLILATPPSSFLILLMLFARSL